MKIEDYLLEERTGSILGFGSTQEGRCLAFYASEKEESVELLASDGFVVLSTGKAEELLSWNKEGKSLADYCKNLSENMFAGVWKTDGHSYSILSRRESGANVWSYTEFKGYGHVAEEGKEEDPATMGFAPAPSLFINKLWNSLPESYRFMKVYLDGGIRVLSR